MTEIYLFDISTVTKTQYDQLLKYASALRMSEIERLKNFHKKRQSLFAELTLKTALSQVYTINNRGYEFQRDSFGRLVHPGHYGYYFSISHSKDLVAVAVSRANLKGQVGVDIEVIRNLSEKHILKICTKDEERFVNASNDGWNERLLQIWTQKEAYVKSIGTGFLNLSCKIEIPINYQKMLNTFKFQDYIVSVVNPDGEFHLTEPSKTAKLMDAYIQKNAYLFE